jgi:hypothetical protein
LRKSFPTLHPGPCKTLPNYLIDEDDDENNNNNNNNNNNKKKVITLPAIQITNTNDDEDFSMPPLETMSPFDILGPLKHDDLVFFGGAISTSNCKPTTTSSRLKRVLSAPKSLKSSGRRRSLGNLFKSRLYNLKLEID